MTPVARRGEIPEKAGMSPRTLVKRWTPWLLSPLRRLIGGSPLLARLTAPPNPVRDDYAAWLARPHAPSPVAPDAEGPTFSVIIPVHETPEALLRDAVASIQAQTWPHWEICLADDASAAPHVRAVLEDLAAQDPRIRVAFRAERGHIAAASNTALGLATGAWVVLLDHDDIIPPDALAALAGTIARHPDAALIFTDEDKFDADGRRFDPNFKPGFDPERLLGQNLVNHLAIYRRDLLERIGGWRIGYEGSQDYDLALRALAAGGEGAVIHHPGVLYHWRQARGGASFSQTWLERCAEAGRRAVADHLRGLGAEGVAVEPAPKVRFWNRLRWKLPEPPASVSLALLAGADPDLSLGAARALKAATDHPVAEILVTTTAPATRAEGATILSCGTDWATRLRRILEAARGEIVVIAGERPVIAAPDWLTELVAQLHRPGVAAVGGPSLTPHERLRHAEVAIAPDGRIVAAYAGARSWESGFAGDLALVHRVAALAGDYIALRRADALAALGEGPVADVALCQRIWARGGVVLWTPHAPLIEAGSPTVPALQGARWTGEVLGVARNPLLTWREGRPALRMD